MTQANHSLRLLTVAEVPGSYWRLLHYFNIYRFTIAGIFMVAVGLYGASTTFGAVNPTQFVQINAIYLLDAVLCLAAPFVFRKRFNLHLTAGVAIDILALTLLMNASGGVRSGIGYLLLAVVAGAGLVGQGRLTLFFAALASLAVLLEQALRVLISQGEPAEFFRAGMISLGFFGVGITARLLASRIAANEALAQRRGEELSDQMRINQSVIRDMEHGVLVVDANGLVRQANPQAEALLAVKVGGAAPLAEFSPLLAERYATWRSGQQEVSEMFRTQERGHFLRARFLPLEVGGNALIYIEDMDRVQAHAQQIKLAALGRLAANMAHEIRNPLAAISHAAELLGEEHLDATHERLTHMIGENAKRLNRLVDDILELGRRDRALVEPIRLKELLDGLVDEMSLHDASVRDIVTVNLSARSCLNFDRGHLYRVLSNLLQNSMRYCRHKSGSVCVEAHTGALGTLELHILDDGPGIDESLSGQIFEPFFTTFASGTGLGLYIARELCEANGAAISLLENSPGAHFRIVGTGTK